MKNHTVIDVDVPVPSILDVLIASDEQELGWADELWAAAELEARRQVLWARCPADLQDIIVCLRTGAPTGRGQRTHKNVVREVRAAVRAPRPKQREMFAPNDQSAEPTPRSPTRRGRPKGSQTRVGLETETDGQGVLV